MPPVTVPLAIPMPFVFAIIDPLLTIVPLITLLFMILMPVPDTPAVPVAVTVPAAVFVMLPLTVLLSIAMQLIAAELLTGPDAGFPTTSMVHAATATRGAPKLNNARAPST